MPGVGLSTDLPSRRVTPARGGEVGGCSTRFTGILYLGQDGEGCSGLAGVMVRLILSIFIDFFSCYLFLITYIDCFSGTVSTTTIDGVSHIHAVKCKAAVEVVVSTIYHVRSPQLLLLLYIVNSVLRQEVTLWRQYRFMMMLCTRRKIVKSIFTPRLALSNASGAVSENEKIALLVTAQPLHRR